MIREVGQMHRLHAVLILALVALLGTACSGAGKYIWAYAVPDDLLRSQPTVIQPGDHLVVTVRDQESLSGAVPVGDDGYAVLPIVGPLEAAGKTLNEFEQAVATRLHKIVVSPNVRVVLAERRATVVSVLGEVRTPGQYELSTGGGVFEALARAGGLTEFADRDRIFLVRKGDPPLRIRFDYQDLVCGESRSHAVELRAGDRVIVE